MPKRKQRGRLSARTAHKLKARFLASYAKLGNATAVEEETGISRHLHKRWLKNEQYRQAFDEADDQATEALEREARRRALDGRDDPVYWNGHQIGSVRKYSDLLLIFLLKAKRPDVYRERYDARINASLNVQSAVKVVHEYHELPPALNVTSQEVLPNRQLMTATETTVPASLAPDTLDPAQPTTDSTTTAPELAGPANVPNALSLSSRSDPDD